MTTYSAVFIATVAFALGCLFHRLLVSYRRLKRVKGRLQESGHQINKLRRQIQLDERSGQPEGLIGWAQHHATRLLEKHEEKRVSALRLAARDLAEAESLEREVELGLCSARSVIDCTERYLSKQARLDNQKMGEFLDDLEALRGRLRTRLDRCPSLVSIREEQERIVRLGERIASERGTLKSDPVVGWRNIQMLLRILNDIDHRLEAKTGDFGRAGR